MTRHLCFRRMNQLLDYFHFKPGEVIGSLGCGGGLWEVGWGVQVDELTFVLIDLVPEMLNEEEIQAAVQYWEKVYQKTSTGQFIPCIGTETQIPLSDQQLDKLVVINAFHEFSEKEAMIAEMKRVLKPGGWLFVEEPLAQYPGEVHEGCGKPLYEPSVLRESFENQDFAYQQAESTSPVSQVFTFQKR